MVQILKILKNMLYDVMIRINQKIRGYDDYFYFTFSTNKPMPASGNIVMKKCCEALEKLGVHYQVSDGTALGLYRQNGFIPHDNDLDVDILGDNVDIEAIQNCFEKELNMTLGRKMSYKGQIQQLTYYSDDEVIFDMIFWHVEGDRCVVRYPEAPKCVLKKKYFDNIYWFMFEGKEYPMHAPIEEWLVDRYGDDWNIPKNSKGDWREDSNFFVGE